MWSLKHHGHNKEDLEMDRLLFGSAPVLPRCPTWSIYPSVGPSTGLPSTQKLMITLQVSRSKVGVNRRNQLLEKKDNVGGFFFSSPQTDSALPTHKLLG